MSDKTPKKKLNKKTIITLVLLFLFVTSISIVLLSKYATPAKVGEVFVTREEVQFLDIRGLDNVTFDSRYLINYGIIAKGDSTLITIRDKTSPGLTQIIVEQTRSKVDVNYNNVTGEIKIQARDLVRNETFKIQVAFQSTSVNAFNGDNIPVTRTNPRIIPYGYNGLIEVNISPFKLKTLARATDVNIYAWFTSLVDTVVPVNSTPPASSTLTGTDATWKYTSFNQTNFDVHAAVWKILVSSDQKVGTILLRTWVEVRYATLLHVTTDPVITDSNGYYFTGGGVAYTYQYEYRMKTS